MKRGIILIAVAIILIMPSIMALGVVPGKLIIPYAPLREEEIIFDVWGPTSVEAETDCPDIITINETIEATDENRAKIVAQIKLPEKMTPGKNTCGVIITKKQANGTQTLGTAVKIIAVIEIDVPYPGRYAIMSLNAPNAMPNEDLGIYTTITNLGTEELDVQADIIIKDYKNNTINTRKTNRGRLGSKESGNFGVTFNAGTLESGKYIAKAIYDYGTEIISAEKPFVIGQLQLELNDYTKEISSNSISPFQVKATSLWGNPLENVYAEIKIFGKDGNVTSSAKMPSITIGPYGTETIDGFIDARRIAPGNYSTEIILHADKNEFMNKVIIMATEPKKEEISLSIFASPYAFLIIILAIIITDIIYMYMLRKKAYGKIGESEQEA